MESEVVLDIEGIRKVIPHRYPFLFLDKVIEFHDNERIVCLKAVSGNEEFFQGHFPFKAVTPGVLILEAIAQAGAVLAALSSEGLSDDKTLFLAGADDVRWKRMVVPGDVLRIEMSFIKKRGSIWKMKGTATVDGQLVASGEITASEVLK